MLNKSSHHSKHVRMIALSLVAVTALFSCAAEETDDGTTEIDYSFSITPHESNVLMVDATITTDEATEVAIQFQSADTEPKATTKSNLSTEHDITVVGLRPETEYEFTAAITTSSGETITSEPQTVTTSSLPFSLPDIQLITSTDSSYAGVTFFAVTGSNARFIGVDEEGVPVWYLDNSNIPMLTNSPAIKHLGDNRLMLMLNSEVWVIDITGNVLSTYELPPYHHEATLLENGNIMVLTNEYGEFDGNSLKGDRIEKYSPAGNLVWEWSSFEHLDTSRFPSDLSTNTVQNGAFDWSHSNAIFYQEDNNSLLLSVRSQSWVVNIDHASGSVNWIMGSAAGNTNNTLDDKFLSLTNGTWMSGQHAPMMNSNGDYLIYDNRNDAYFEGSASNSRAVEYQINPNMMTATQVWEFEVDKYTKSLGDVDELPNGNILITAGGPGSNTNAYLVEATKDSEVAWELHINDESVYRAERVGWDALLTLNQDTAETFSLSGQISGLHGDGLTLANGEESVTITAGATTFEFSELISEGSSYNIEIASLPGNHTCAISNGSGTVSNDVTDIIVECNDNQINADLTHLPIGDSLISQRMLGDTPEAGKLWLCRVPEDGAGAAPSDDWTNEDGTWNYIIKPQVQGENYYTSELSITLNDQGERIVAGNALPTTPTGTFPIEPGTTAYSYDKNPNYISAANFEIIFDAIPTQNPEPNCVGFGATGISLTGSAIYHGSSTLGTDAATYEMLDKCGGHTDGTETYHYHYLSECVLNELDPDNGGHSALVGYIMDGFGIYGPRGEDGEVLSSADLDECHGHTHAVEWDGEYREMYHYHWTYDFPYNVGCYRGTPQPSWN